MSIIVSQHGKNAAKLERTSFGLEDRLQQYIYDNPESIPLYDIKEDVRLLILAREFSTASGPIDAVGIDQDGQLYLIETKFYKNPDKRTVVAQVLDYGASLWKQHSQPETFIQQLSQHTQKQFNLSVPEKIQDFFGVSDDAAQEILSHMGNDLSEGTFKFVVLMDNMHDQLKDLILYMNQNSKFDIYGVELEYYRHDSFEIVIPKLFGSEIKKDLSTKTADAHFFTNEEFISIFSADGYSEQIRAVLELYAKVQSGSLVFASWQARRTPKTISFTYTSPGHNGQSLAVSTTIWNKKAIPTVDFWLSEKEIEQKVNKVISQILSIPAIPFKPGVSTGIVARWDVKKFKAEQLIKLFEMMSGS